MPVYIEDCKQDLNVISSDKVCVRCPVLGLCSLYGQEIIGGRMSEKRLREEYQNLTYNYPSSINRFILDSHLTSLYIITSRQDIHIEGGSKHTWVYSYCEVIPSNLNCQENPD